MTPFLQEPPKLPDAWSDDPILREGLEWHLGGVLFAAAQTELADVGRWSTAPETLEAALRAENEPPELVHYSTWGERVDEIRVSSAYVELGREGVRRGVVSLPYEAGPYGEKARIVWAALIHMWGPSSALYSCPIAMTDAAARTLLLYGGPEDLEVVERLVSRDPAVAWSSGQWMTETAGGSDVGRTGTIARHEDGGWRLYGTKWFTSATTSDMALTLARPEGGPAGSRGLALFRVHRQLDDGTSNRIFVRRLKDKLGTRSLPTAELELDGALAFPVGEVMDGGGLRRISTMLNLTRLHNSIAASAAIARGLGWARGYASVREVFGKRLEQHPAHRVTLGELATDHAAALALVLRCAQLIGKVEHGSAGQHEEAVVRGLTPVTKLATARWAVADAAEAMEALGGVGYCEDSGLPALVRNAHVLPIWEGTTNVLALDLLRAEGRSGALGALLDDASRIVSEVSSDPAVQGAASEVLGSLDSLKGRIAAATVDENSAQAAARSIALSVAKVYAGSLLCAQGAWASSRGRDQTARFAHRFAERGLLAPPPPTNLDLAFGGADASGTSPVDVS
ncbi:MAG: acyl-CoA dehydrogenase family protein [Actinomycetota bacterium]